MFMKLYSARLSPFATRARIAVYAKGLDVEILLPPGGPRSAEYLAINPIGKIPCLVTDKGGTIPESDTIVEYLDERFPEPSLLPGDAEARARVRLLSRVGEVYVMAPISRLWPQLDPAARDAAAVEALFGEIDQGLGRLEALLAGGDYAFGGRLTQADCQLAPTLAYVPAMGAMFGKGDRLQAWPKVAAYARAVVRDPHVARALGEMNQAMAHYGKTGQIT